LHCGAADSISCLPETKPPAAESVSGKHRKLDASPLQQSGSNPEERLDADPPPGAIHFSFDFKSST
jgi:hypothetical protein